MTTQTHGPTNRKLRIAINAQLPPDGGAGGTETVLTALAAIAQLSEGREEYIFVGPAADSEWLRPWLGPEQEIVPGPLRPVKKWKRDSAERLKHSLGPFRPLARDLKRWAITRVERKNIPDAGPNFYERLGCDVVHFPFQSHEVCRIPTVFSPHDLQHKHFPSFFSDAEIAQRDDHYARACHAAHTVVVASQAVKQDVQFYYQINPQKIEVIPWAPPPVPQQFQATKDSVRTVCEKYDLVPESFVLCPAMTWEHKNHLRLLEAVALLRDRDQRKIRLVCTGEKKGFWPAIDKSLRELRLKSQVTFLGMIPFADLRALYGGAQFVILPSLFEAASAPLFEAWQHHVPVACSQISGLVEQAGEAALLFDPLSVTSIADALMTMSTSASLRARLRTLGTHRLQHFSIERTAEAYREVYRRAAGWALNEEDNTVLNQTPSPQRGVVYENNLV